MYSSDQLIIWRATGDHEYFWFPPLPMQKDILFTALLIINNLWVMV